MKKLIFLFTFSLFFIACATKLRIGNFDLDTRTLPRDSVFAVTPLCFFSRRNRYLDRQGFTLLDEEKKSFIVSSENIPFMIPLEKDPLLDLCVDEETKAHVHSDIWLQSNLTRVSESPIGIQNLLIDRFKNTKSDYTGFDESVPESVIMSCMSNRRIQTASELRAFTDQLDNYMSNLSEQIKLKEETSSNFVDDSSSDSVS